ncbi:hypothetical protein DR88_5241 [Klebsiella pneumoniae]|nr:hypothetical protein DR88_5241 [Klebsiella pneumoniae]
MVVRNNCDVDQREFTTIQLAGQLRSTECLQPAHRIWVWCDLPMIEQDWDNQRQLLVAGGKVALHGGNRIPH